ncbi:MAG: RNA methyltransferase [Psychromonas sp.]|nr:RNA methyltransferase [Psychromonas sp.]
MITKNQFKLIRSLDQKKHRKKQGFFLIQGQKNVDQLLHSNFTIQHIFATPQYIDKIGSILTAQFLNKMTTEATAQELTKAGTLNANNSVIAIAEIKVTPPPNITENELVLVLDQVGDPGNFGTIIRVADWYGIKHIICSPDCADFYNPKVIAATMGAFTRVSISMTELTHYLKKQKEPIYGAFLQGKNIHKIQLSQSAFIVMGSESHGISAPVSKFINTKITIPNFGRAESLNVAMATGIILDNFKRT